MRSLACAALVAATLLLSSPLRAAPGWDPSPWLSDLDAIRVAIDRDYPNRDWLTHERGVVLDSWFDRAANAIRTGGDDAGARRALDALITRFRDGHVELTWPRPAATSGPPAAAPPADAAAPPADAAAFCAAHGYASGQVTPGTAAVLPGYRALDSGGPFATGLIDAGDTRVGVIRIGVFDPHGYPALCASALADRKIAADQPCDDACEEAVTTQAYIRLTRGLATGLEYLRAAGAEVLLVDITRNGGGSEWAEAAARMVTPKPLRSAPVMVVRGQAWVERWRALAISLRTATEGAPRADRTLPADLARRADAVANGLAPCSGCSRLAMAGYASGLLPELRAGALDGKPWGPSAFSPAQFPYRDGVWSGPLIVLVDDETWSAAEQFAALLQDNRAAVIMGTRTGGAGCGHLDGNDPITLPHSKATLELPNCARLRRDGSNEVNGIVPDVPSGARSTDGTGLAGRLTAARLPEAIVMAKRLAKAVALPLIRERGPV